MKQLLLTYSFLLLLLLASALLPAVAQHEGFLYGEVLLTNNERHKGQILWSAGQTMWVDLLTAEKKDNPVLKYLNNEQLEKLSIEETQKKMDWGFMNLWKNQYPSRKHTFRARFGDIASISVTGGEEAVVVFKNGEKFNIFINDDPEYKNQLGKNIRLYNASKEKVTIAWDKIAQIRFVATPSELPHLTTLPLYGTISTRSGSSYTGLLQWDKDEALTTNFVDGKDEENQKIKIRFRDVKSIRPKNEGALLTLTSGKEVFMQGTSNVSRSNQGLVVRHPDWGQVIIRWRDFKEASFAPYPENENFGYDAFQKPRSLKGSIFTTDNKTWRGTFVFDLDERLDLETLDGWDKAGALRMVPFRFVKQITPISSKQTQVLLRNGEKLILGDRSDVNETNWGLLVYPQQGEYKYIPWNIVNRIVLY
ncbi:hypothetical protein FVR03_19800 [Pontibacter qinzhouensis]|uniref:Uncharacterized protein n=1 Tax=Pontibacter qinzhouensis TaxID=2603253 RepID=A0A5C8J589_9BACT|nr:hypothetical protein [Pontibacter qinzhouensis]TXK31169.1 hypothetical protein FVR03_19800 [Pontibacter qinzhouensis]